MVNGSQSLVLWGQARVVPQAQLLSGSLLSLAVWRLGVRGWQAVRFGPRRALPLKCGACGHVMVLVAVRRKGNAVRFAAACGGPRGCGSGCLLSRCPANSQQEAS